MTRPYKRIFLDFSPLKNFSKKEKIMLDKSETRVIISVFCLSRRYSSIGRATDL